MATSNAVTLPAGGYDYSALKTVLEAVTVLPATTRSRGAAAGLSALRSGSTAAAALDAISSQVVKPGIGKLAASQSTAGWTVASNVTLSTKAYPVPAPSGRTNGLSIAKPTTGTFGGARTVPIPSNFRLSNVALVGAWIYWSGDTGSVSLRFSSDAFAAKRREIAWAWSGQIHKGWNLLMMRPDDDGTTPLQPVWATVGAQALNEVINGIQISISTPSGTANEIFVDDVIFYTAPPVIGSVGFGFDAWGEASIANIMVPLFNEERIAGYWAGDGNLIQNPGNPRNYVTAAYQAGWDIISQGMNHPDYTVAGDAQLGTDFDAAKAILQGLGFTNALDLFAYPLSANNPATDAMLVSKGVRMARSGWAWPVRPNEFNAGPKLIGHGAFNLGGKTLTQAKKLVDLAAYSNARIDFYCHGGQEGGDGTAPPADTAFWFKNDMRSLIQYTRAHEGEGRLVLEKPTRYLDRFTIGRP